MTSDRGKDMSEFPEVARRRLSRVAGGGDHPDAGLLTAFVEGTLTKTHRDGVFDHLVACSQCNQLVSLIAPEREVGSVAQPAEVRRGWFAWIPVRWAGVAAAAAVVVSAVVIGRIGQPIKGPSTPSAVVERAPSPGMTAQLPVPAIAAQSSTPGPANKASHRAAKLHGLTQRPAVSPQTASAQGDPAVAAQSRPAAPGGVPGETAFQTSMFQTSIMSGPDSLLELSPSGIEPPPVKPEPVPIIATPPTPTGPIWSVSDAGVLQTSNDSGHTWAAVAVPTRLPMHAVSVSGLDVWTGGDQGALYHSADAGQTWTAVVPTSNGMPLSADIMRIAFSDLRHGWIATRNGDIWMTRDGGASWSRK
jgi:hypothetical protein